MFYWNTGIALERESLYDFCCAVRAHQMITNEFTKELRDNFNQAINGLDEAQTPNDWTGGRAMTMDQFKSASAGMLDLMDQLENQIQAPPPVVD